MDSVEFTLGLQSSLRQKRTPCFVSPLTKSIWNLKLGVNPTTNEILCYMCSFFIRGRFKYVPGFPYTSTVHFSESYDIQGDGYGLRQCQKYLSLLGSSPFGVPNKSGCLTPVNLFHFEVRTTLNLGGLRPPLDSSPSSSEPFVSIVFPTGGFPSIRHFRAIDFLSFELHLVVRDQMGSRIPGRVLVSVIVVSEVIRLFGTTRPRWGFFSPIIPF